MLLIDDLLCFPVRGLFMIFSKIHEAAQQDADNEADAIRTQLSELYLLLETGQLSDEEFDRQEKELLDRLDEIEASPSSSSGEEEGADGDGESTHRQTM